ncbi:MAG TPA: hypothetical protein VJW95_03965 [Dissulfurispiraceae bacterium]|nr:hypothetical protein [Dissulfurispiraceae bacterium]
MKPQDEKVDKIEKALKSAYRKNDRIRVKPEWESELMYHILSLPANPLRTYTLWEAPAVWRTATAVGISALIMLLFTFVNNIGPEYEAARLMLEDPSGFTFAQLLFP